MSDFLLDAQIAATAHLLRVDPDDVAYLRELDVQSVAQLRRAIAASFFDEESAMFSRVSRLAPLVPDRLVASVSEKAVPPLVSGRIAGALAVDHPSRIGGVLNHMSAAYMADCAPHIDHRVVDTIAEQVDPDHFVPAAHELLDRGDHVTAAIFVEHAPIPLARAFEQEIEDDRGLLLTVAMVADDEKVQQIVHAFPQRVQVLLAGVGAWDDTAVRAALSLLGRLDVDHARQLLAEALTGLDDDVVHQLATRVRAQGLEEDFLALTDDPRVRQSLGASGS